MIPARRKQGSDRALGRKWVHPRCALAPAGVLEKEGLGALELIQRRGPRNGPYLSLPLTFNPRLRPGGGTSSSRPYAVSSQ